MAEIKQLERKFVLVKGDSKIDLQDINRTMSPDQIKDVYTNTYPELINSKIENKGIENDKEVYHFTTIAGTKG